MKISNLFVAAIATVILASCGGEATTSTEGAVDSIVVEAPADTVVVADTTVADSVVAE